MTTTLQKYRNTIIFFLVILDLYIAGVLIAFHVGPTYRDYVAGVTLPLDLMIFIPALFYFLVVRKYKLTPLLVLPVIWLGSLVITQVVQPRDLQFVFVLMALTFAVEIAIGVHEGRRIVRCYREVKRTSDDPRMWFEETFFTLTRNRKASKLASMELTVMWYSLFSWRKKPVVEVGAKYFSYHKESGYASLVAVLMGVAVIEIAAVHVLISQWNVTIAFIVTILSTYAMFYLLGALRASVLRPIKVESDTLEINSGLRTPIRIPFDLVKSVGTTNPELGKKATLDLSMMGSDNCWVVLKEDMEIEGFYGGKQTKRAIGLTLDNAPDFRSAVQEGLSRSGQAESGTA